MKGRSSMAVSKHKRRDTWYASFYYQDWTGERRRKKKEGFATKKEALAFQREFLERSAGQCTMSFASFAKIYLNYCQKRVKPSTYTTKEVAFRRYLLPYFSELAMADIEPRQVHSWQEQLAQDAAHLSGGYKKYIHSQLAAVFHFAERYYYLGRNPLKQCSAPDGNDENERRKMRFWTLAQFKSFAGELYRKSPEYVIFHLLFWTGLRRGEMLALRPESFDFEQKRLTIERNLVYIKGIKHMTTPKTKYSRRSICLPDFLLDMVDSYIKRSKIAQGSRIFDVHPSKLGRCIRRICKEIGLPPISLHGFRHSHASMLIEQGVQPLLIAERLGHRDVQVTLKVYSHLYPHKHRALAEQLNRLYER